MSLLSARIESLPSSAFYISEFVSEAEERVLVEKITSAPPSKWTSLTHRRLQSYPTTLLKGALLPTSDPLPKWLEEPCVDRMRDLGIWHGTPHASANHCLVNIYEPGQGIMPHEDGDAYYPMVATVSLNAGIVLEIYDKPDSLDEPVDRAIKYRIYQEPRSLLVTTDLMYTSYLHGIQEITADTDLSPDTIANWPLLSESTQALILDHMGALRDSSAVSLVREKTRISLTFRDVKRVKKLTGLLSKR
ncbi:uncharacterized protein V1516DRAFT_662752 [Lipomyces oligophaga]|uniref:uncharacterized protein n=1 Tax=Lipomyces oligophaga TaxID=45792 RepID=UPI0034CD01C5